ncbi:hypothetical protein F511_08757 [Dorcoceras hygrometricum]|uniref:Subtilisin-like protease-like n=1 Tax=Dorcoceras hygrometricum TaxID=472368 RepID=A0A2Z7ACP2_9LAMI|nr:hypothetical protein F511_08757 [Dorcoceras hygrometricum]
MGDSQLYVVYMGSKGSANPDDIFRQNHQILSAVHGGRSVHTTHSWDFMGLKAEESMEIPGYSTKNQVNVIIGFIDTGIWPESPSFSDVNMPPVPNGWRGLCQSGEAFNSSTCNRKLIGAKYYLRGFQAEEELDETLSYQSPRDSIGHGSHTASTAAGRYVANMNYKGLATGKARGGAPISRIAVYKACWTSGCYDADLLAAFDDAIRDGVHILSVSLGSEGDQRDYFSDAISVGSFHAVSHGITVVASVGNRGSPGSATNLAPWLITVAALSTDRDFTSDIFLGNGTQFEGESLSVEKMNISRSLIPASEAYAGSFTPDQASYCLESSLDSTKAKNKVLVCRHAEGTIESKVAKSVVVQEAGGVGMILIDEEDKDIAIPFPIPAAIVGEETGKKILSYIKDTRDPTSMILSAKTVFGSKVAPQVATFSSKGPNSLTPEILKPDIAAPGLNILASWSPAISKDNFKIISGTSMACPHVTGIVALIKAVHKSWSPSAIKSALMTTASMLDEHGQLITAGPDGRKANAFDLGSGFLNPRKVLDPGLVYDSTPTDYKAFLCSIGYSEKTLRMITGDNSTCNRTFPTPSSLNYPSITVPNLKNTFTVSRMVTNVGSPSSIYTAVVFPPPGINVTVVPERLVFTSYLQKISFTVKFEVTGPVEDYVFGSLSWRNEKSWVTSPLVARVAKSKASLMA